MTKNLKEELEKIVLLPCPFCGSHNIELEEHLGGVIITPCAIGCNSAFCNGNVRRQKSWATKNNAIEAWNRRAK